MCRVGTRLLGIGGLGSGRDISTGECLPAFPQAITPGGTLLGRMWRRPVLGPRTFLPARAHPTLSLPVRARPTLSLPARARPASSPPEPRASRGERPASRRPAFPRTGRQRKRTGIPILSRIGRCLLSVRDIPQELPDAPSVPIAIFRGETTAEDPGSTAKRNQGFSYRAVQDKNPARLFYGRHDKK